MSKVSFGLILYGLVKQGFDIAYIIAFIFFIQRVIQAQS